jgi:hypothetical protein
LRERVFGEWKDGGWNRSAVAICKDGGIGPFTFDIAGVETALVTGCSDDTQRDAMWNYWTKTAGDWCPDCVRSLCDSLVKLSKQDADSKEAVQSIKTIKYELEISPTKTPWEGAYGLSFNNDVLLIKAKVCYNDWPIAALGDGSGNKVVTQLTALF